MNWGEILTQIILSIVGIILSSLGVYVTYFINKKIKNEELKRLINSLNELVQNAVLETYQTYVEELKNKNIFDAEAQKNAYNHALHLIKVNMPADVEKWLQANFTDVERYLKTLIEANIGLLKNKTK